MLVVGQNKDHDRASVVPGMVNFHRIGGDAGRLAVGITVAAGRKRSNGKGFDMVLFGGSKNAPIGLPKGFFVVFGYPDFDFRDGNGN